MAEFDNPNEDLLEQAWQLINNMYYEGLEIETERPVLSDDPLGKLAFFMEFDLYPPPELLMQIVQIYEIYIAKKGV